ncbi:MAG: hypothetical protein MR890_04820 [Akkermansia muciniphila]|nr:hypothetical protein [Akkermansia muciniphila]
MLCPFSLTMLLISPLALFSFFLLPVEGEPPVMPKAEAPESIKNELILDVRKEGDQLGIRVDGRECTREELPELLKTMAQQDPDRCVRIRGGEEMPRERMELIRICSEAGFSNLIFSSNFNLQEQ